MSIDNIIDNVVEAINLIPELSEVLVVADNGYVDEEQKMKIRQRSVWAKVRRDGFEPVKQSPETIIGDAWIVVSLYEKPSVNRKKTGAVTLPDIAIAVAKALTYAQAEGMEIPLFLQRITPISELGEQSGGTVTCDVVFRTKAEL